MALPQPRDLDNGCPHRTTARTRDALTALEFPTGVRARSQAEKACDLPPVAKLAIIDLTCHDGRTGRTDAFQSQELEALLLGFLARHVLVALFFGGCDLLLDECQPLYLPCDFPGQTRWKGSSLSG